MLELGAAAPELHQEVGRMAAECVDDLFLFGELAGELKRGAVEAGLAADKIVVGKTHAELADRIRRRLRAGDRLLVKGSRGMQLEKVVNLLKPLDHKSETD